MQQIQTKKITAMTLVEVLVALSVVSFVFSSLIAMSFDALVKAKKLEMQDQMRSLATEAVEVIYFNKDKDWSMVFDNVLPYPEVTQSSIAYVNTINATDSSISNKILTKFTGPEECKLTSEMVLSGNCIHTIKANSNERQLFGRIIERLKNDSGDSSDSVAKIRITVTCLEEECDTNTYQPFVLNYKVFKTSASN